MTISQARKTRTSFACDRCGKEISSVTDAMESQEARHISFVGGPTSVFGEGKQVEADICQTCLKKLIRDFCRVFDPSTVTERETPIKQLGISEYTLRRLTESGVTTIEQLCNMEEVEVKKAAGGSSAFREVAEAMEAITLKLAA